MKDRLRAKPLRRGMALTLCLSLCLLLGSCSFSLEDAMVRLKAYVNGTEIEEPPEGFVESRENESFSYDVYTDHVILTGYKGEKVSVSVPRTIDDLPVTTIGELAFYYGVAVESVILPNTVTTLADNAFYYCRSMRMVSLPDSITSIGDKCFSWCSSLESVVLPSKLTSIPDYCFNECTALTTVTLPDGLKTVGTRAFSGCAALEGLYFPDGVESVGGLVFRDCAALTALRLPGGCTVGENAFTGCPEELIVATARNSVCWKACKEQEVNVEPDTGTLPLPDTSEDVSGEESGDASSDESSEES